MFDEAIAKARKSRFVQPVRSLYRRIRRVPRHSLQDMKVRSGLNFVHLGSDYGGWTFVHHPDLFGSTIISAGLGEDASFDIEFATTYNAKVIIVDPTPRAVTHFKAISKRLGSANVRNYSGGGAQPVEAYDLSGISESHLTLVPRALWNRSTTIKFFQPVNEKYVSHSAVNFRRNYGNAGKYIEVESITMSELLEEYGLINGSDLQLVKLDIEGAEVEVVSDLLDRGIRPRQIAVEFHEFAPSDFTRVDCANGKLNDAGYQCVWTDGGVNFLYITEDFLAQL